MTQVRFRQRCRAEWKRLNPRYVGDSDTPWQAFIHALHEGVIGCFALLRFAWWIVIRSWRA